MNFYSLFVYFFGSRLSLLNRCDFLLRSTLFFTATSFFYLFLSPSSFSNACLQSYWDGPHELGIISALSLLYIFCVRNHFPFKWILWMPISTSLFILSGNRSSFAAIFICLLIHFLLTRNILAFSIISALLYLVLSSDTFLLTGKALDYLPKRIEQYTMAFQVFDSTYFLGIGPDKMGSVGGLVGRSFCFNNVCTSTMDSSILKYTINYGVLFFPILLSWLFLLQHSYSKSFQPMHLKPFIFYLIVFALINGLVTGKLGAYPLNFYFYTSLGIVATSYSRSLKSSAHSY